MGITQERAAEIMVKTQSVVELEVAKQGAIYHGLAPLLSQPSPLMSRASGGMPQQQYQPGSTTQQQPFAPISQSKSVSSLYPSQDSNQKIFHNQNETPTFKSGVNEQSKLGYNRSSSVQNLNPAQQTQQMFHQQQQQLQHLRQQHPSFEEQGYYQNVTMPVTNVAQSKDVRNLNMSGDLFHASPRVSGTPLHDSTAPGPEKPQRQYSYMVEERETISVHQDKWSGQNGDIPLKQNGNSTNTVTMSRVRFQEPVERRHKVKYQNLHSLAVRDLVEYPCASCYPLFPSYRTRQQTDSRVFLQTKLR